MPQEEIEEAVRNSEAVAWAPGARKAQGPATLSASMRNESAVQAVTDAPDAPGLADLWEASPIRFDGDEPATEAIIDALFPIANVALRAGLPSPGRSAYITGGAAWREESCDFD